MKGHINKYKKRFLFNSLSYKEKDAFSDLSFYFKASVLQRKLKNLLEVYKNVRFIQTFI